MSSNRGMLTPEIKLEAIVLLGVDDFTQSELRLMPYIQYVMMNDQVIEPCRINSVERDILVKWRERDWIDFWDNMNQILWLAYVDDEG